MLRGDRENQSNWSKLCWGIVKMMERKSNDTITDSIKGDKDTGEIKVVIWQLYHQHRWNLVPM